MNVRVAIACFGTRHIPSALVAIDSCLSKMGLLKGREVHLFDNSLNSGESQILEQSVFLHPGDNSHREFSAYEKAIKMFSGVVDSPDQLVMLCNDTFHRNYGADYLNNLPKATELPKGQKWLAGWIDSYPEPVRLMSYRFRSWIRSSFFLTQMGSLQSLMPLVLTTPNSYFFYPNFNPNFFLPGVPASNNYLANIRAWLFGEYKASNPFQEKWHSQASLIEANYGQMIEKCRCIFTEHLLSCRISEFDFDVFDLNRTRWMKLEA